MANLNQIETKVANLKATSIDDEYIDLYADIEQAGKVTPDSEISKLRGIVHNFVLKIPNESSLKRTRRDANDLATALTLATLAVRLARIRARNDALDSLSNKLDAEIIKANADKGRLIQIREKIDMATATVAQIKTLITNLQVTDLSTKGTIEALVTALSGISSIFAPTET